VVWLKATGAWPYFWEVFTEWNREYVEQWVGPVERGRYLLFRLLPWGLLHLAAVPRAVAAVWRGVGRARGDVPSCREPLLAGLYLGLLSQVLLFQHPFDYVLVPPALLAVAVTAGPVGRTLSVRTGPGARTRVALVASLVAGFALAAVVLHPLLRRDRLALWARCWHEGSSPELRDRLALMDTETSVDWEDLAAVAAYLRKEKVEDGEVICYNNSTHPLYLRLQIKPGARFTFFNLMQLGFRSRHEEIREELRQNKRARFIVSDLRAVPPRDSLTRAQAAERPGPPYVLPPAFPAKWRQTYPWNEEEIAFRAGRYVVYRVLPGHEPAPLVPKDF
jgi:hypothetical protein